MKDLTNPAHRARIIRSVFAFPFGHTFAWRETDLQVDERDRMLVEWGLFQRLHLNSRRTYASTVTTYLRWADEVGCQDPWPLTETRAALFAAWRLRVGNCQLSTITANFSHLQEFHRNLGIDCWDWTKQPRLSGTLRGWRSACRPPHPSERQPWLFEIFPLWFRLVPFSADDIDAVCVWTAALTLFWSLAQGSEALATSARKPDKYRTLRWRNFELFDDYAVIHLITAKHDRFHQGSDLLLPQLDDKRFCPVHWLGILLNLQQRRRTTTADSWIFALHDGCPLSMEKFRREIKAILPQLKLKPEKYNTHSFRIGGATELFRRGFSPEVIKKLGRWKGDTFEMYTRPDAALCAQWAKSILTRPILSHLDSITFLFGDEWRLRNH